MTADPILADRTGAMDVSAIREILKVVSRPGMISLAGGIPSPESFPMEILSRLTERVLTRHGPSAFQYDRSEGFRPLQEALSDHLAAGGIAATADEILITSGSQGALDTLGKVLISRGDRVAVEAPTYLGALQAFNAYGPVYAPLETDADGLVPASLERLLAGGQVKFVYLVPTFQNPTGRTLTVDRRMRVAELLRRHDVLLVEDDPYSALRYRGDSVPSIRSLAPEHVVYVGTFSKTFAPGLRVGFCLAPPRLRSWLVTAKQGNDLHTATFNQALAAEYLAGGHLERHLPRIVARYAPRRDALLAALARWMPDGFGWSDPDGGMFVWLQGPVGLDSEALYRLAVQRNVAFVPGRYFFPGAARGRAAMRLNFTMHPEAAIERAVRTLADVIARGAVDG